MADDDSFGNPDEDEMSEYEINISWEQYEYDLECGAHVKVIREIVYMPRELADEDT